MKNNLRTAPLLLLFTALGLTAAVVNGPIATVNSDPILLSEYEKNWSSFLEQQKDKIPAEQLEDPSWKQEARKHLLDQMIEEKLLLQEAKKRKIKVNEREFETGMAQIKARFLPEGGQKELQTIVQKQLAAKPASPDAPEPQVDLGMAWKDLVKANPDAVKEAEIKFSQELIKEGLTPKKFEERIRDQLSVIQLTNSVVREKAPRPSEEDKKALFNQLLMVMQGKEPAGVSPERGQDLAQMARYLSQETGERVRARHILLKFPDKATPKDKETLMKKILDIRKKIMAGAEFSEMAEKYSDDKGSAEKGGDLGFFVRGRMVPPFEKTAFSLPVGEVSNVVETQFGYHLIRVEEKKAATKLKYEDVESDLGEYLFKNGAQKAMEGFIAELRKTATIKVTETPAASK